MCRGKKSTRVKSTIRIRRRRKSLLLNEIKIANWRRLFLKNWRKKKKKKIILCLHSSTYSIEGNERINNDELWVWFIPHIIDFSLQFEGNHHSLRNIDRCNWKFILRFVHGSSYFINNIGTCSGSKIVTDWISRFFHSIYTLFGCVLSQNDISNCYDFLFCGFSFYFTSFFEFQLRPEFYFICYIYFDFVNFQFTANRSFFSRAAIDNCLLVIGLCND
jgi:hypothetical protein